MPGTWKSLSRMNIGVSQILQEGAEMCLCVDAIVVAGYLLCSALDVC